MHYEIGLPLENHELFVQKRLTDDEGEMQIINDSGRAEQSIGAGLEEMKHRVEFMSVRG